MYIEDKFRDECGIMGVYSSRKEEVSRLVYYGLYSLQHRGQESAGIAVCQNDKIDRHRAMGLVSEVFDDEVLDKLTGAIGVGHVRYSTTGDSSVMNAQPLVVNHKGKDIALAHNGNLVNAEPIRERLGDEGVFFQTSIDSEIIAALLARHHNGSIEQAMLKTMQELKGAYALVVMTEGKLIGVKDPMGIRPLCLGEMDDTFVFASETCALDTLGAKFVKELEPGEMIVVEGGRWRSYKADIQTSKHFCIFELIYFARPDSIFEGINAHSYRYKTGRLLAREEPVEADRVIAVPDSGTPGAIGYAHESGVAFGIGLIKNRYVGRTFIQPTQELREQGVRIKLNVLKKNVEGKRVIIVDDSIVRGTTSRHLVELLRQAGAKEVHFRVNSPPVTNPCHFGIDTPSKEQLIGARKSKEEIRKILNANTLSYLSPEAMFEALNVDTGYCAACFNGKYPMAVPCKGNKMLFE